MFFSILNKGSLKNNKEHFVDTSSYRQKTSITFILQYILVAHIPVPKTIKFCAASLTSGNTQLILEWVVGKLILVHSMHRVGSR